MKIDSFYVTGIAIRTSNEKGKAAIDIPQLWNRFITEQIAGQITGKVSDDVYAVYTEYEKDFTRPYTMVLGCRVDANAAIPEGMKKIIVQSGNYHVSTARGKLDDGIVYKAWETIWNTPLNRTYRTDFEVYGAKATKPAAAEVDIFVGIE